MFASAALVATLAYAQVVGPTTLCRRQMDGWQAFVIIVAIGASICSAWPNEYAARKTHSAYSEIVAKVLATYTQARRS